VPWYWNSFLKFHFNASEVFGASREDELNNLKDQHVDSLEVPFPEVAITCLQAKIRLAILWMTIDPTPLSSFLRMMDDVVYVTSSSEGVRSGHDPAQLFPAAQANADDEAMAN
jgi:hypothetical protein